MKVSLKDYRWTAEGLTEDDNHILNSGVLRKDVIKRVSLLFNMFMYSTKNT